MKINTWMVSFLLVISPTYSWSQLRIDPSGSVGLGWNWPNPAYKLHVKGNVLLTTYPEVPDYPGGMFIELKMKVGNGNPGAEIGTNVNKIAFWSTEAGYNRIECEGVWVESDSSSKKNMRPVPDALNKIRLLGAYKYEMKEVWNGVESSRFGFMAQDVLQVLPEAVDSVKGILLVDYNQVVPLLVQALKEATLRVDSLSSELAALQTDVNRCCSEGKTSTEIPQVIGASASRLFQNRPNPFREKTLIEFEIGGDGFGRASIMIFDLNGVLKRHMPITSKGRGAVEVDAGQLTAGMYLYSLVVDDVEIETRRMILTD